DLLPAAAGEPDPRPGGAVLRDVLDRGRLRLEPEVAAVRQPPGDEVLDDLGLGVEHHVAAGERAEVDAVPAPAEAQLDPLVHGPLAVQPVADARGAQRGRGTVLDHPGALPRLAVAAVAPLQHDGVD